MPSPPWVTSVLGVDTTSWRFTSVESIAEDVLDPALRFFESLAASDMMLTEGHVLSKSGNNDELHELTATKRLVRM